MKEIIINQAEVPFMNDCACVKYIYSKCAGCVYNQDLDYHEQDDEYECYCSDEYRITFKLNKPISLNNYYEYLDSNLDWSDFITNPLLNVFDPKNYFVRYEDDSEYITHFSICFSEYDTQPIFEGYDKDLFPDLFTFICRFVSAFKAY